MYRLYLIGLAIAVAMAVGCGADDPLPGPTPDNDTLPITCPASIVIPINCPSDPASLGLYPHIVNNCMDQPFLTYTDSLITGGIRRIWVVSDTCGNADTCIQSIGQGAPDTCD